MSASVSALLDEGVSGSGNRAKEYFPPEIYPSAQSGGSWWEQTNWFRHHTQQPSNQPPAAPPSAPSLHSAASDPSAPPPPSAPTPVTPSTSLRTPYQHTHSNVVEYGGVDPLDRAYRTHLLHPSPSSTSSITDAPGHAACYNRFVTSTSSPATPPTTSSTTTTATTTHAPPPTKRQVILQAAQGYAPSVVRQLQEYVLLPLVQPSLFSTLGLSASRGVLLSGQSGSGKSLLLTALVTQLGLYYHSLDGAQLAAGEGGSGGGAAVVASGDDRLTVIDRVFTAAKKHAPALIFIDELDSISPPRTSSDSLLLTKLRAALRRQMDGLASQPPLKPVIVVGAVSTTGGLCESMLRPGRFERSIVLNKPDEEGRRRMLQGMVRGMKVGADIDLAEVARRTAGFVGSDLTALCREAGLECIREALRAQREREGQDGDDDYALPCVIDPALLASLSVQHAHFMSAIPLIAPASTRSFAEVAPLTAASLGGNEAARLSLHESIQLPLIHAALFRRFNLPSASSTLLYGPPGCGKTMMARVIASTYGVSFLSIKGPELLSSYLGESEKKVRELFNKARAASPCVLFFDEVDAIATRRGVGNDPTIDRVINSLLIEMDQPPPPPPPSSSSSSSSSSSPSPPLVFVIAATNRPDLLDPALLRPGRFEQLLYVSLPDEASRVEIVKAVLGGTEVEGWEEEGGGGRELGEGGEGGVKEGGLEGLARRMEGFSGADIALVVNSAKRLAVREELEGTGLVAGGVGKVKAAHLEAALSSARPSVTEDMLERYEYFHTVLQRKGENRRSEADEEGEDEGEEGGEEEESKGEEVGEANEEEDEKKTPSEGGLEALRKRIRSAVAVQMSAGRTSQEALNVVLRDFMSGQRKRKSRRGGAHHSTGAEGEDEKEEETKPGDANERRPRRPMLSGLNAM